MWDFENVIGTAGNPVDATPEQSPANPDQWGEVQQEGQQTGQPEEQPEGQPDKQQGVLEGENVSDKYKELIAGMWESVVNDMIERYEKVNELLDNPEALKELTKEELVQLYTLKDNLHKNLSEILPALYERNRTQMSSYLWWIEHPEIKDYVTKLMDELSEPEEVEALVKVVKDVVNILNKNNPVQWESSKPINLKNTLGGWDSQSWKSNIDFEQAMLSSDPQVRAEAIKAFDAQLANWQAQERKR